MACMQVNGLEHVGADSFFSSLLSLCLVPTRSFDQWASLIFFCSVVFASSYIRSPAPSLVITYLTSWYDVQLYCISTHTHMHSTHRSDTHTVHCRTIQVASYFSICLLTSVRTAYANQAHCMHTYLLYRTRDPVLEHKPRLVLC